MVDPESPAGRPAKGSRGGAGERTPGGAAGGDRADRGRGPKAAGRSQTGRETGPVAERQPAARAGAPGAGRRPDGRAAGPQAGQQPTGRGRRQASREELEQRTYDPRREERRKATRVPLPDDVEPRMLDPETRKELRTLSRETADLVARHLVVTGQLVDVEPERALLHARAARALAGRVGVVREACGVAAYAAGEWAEALAELRAARRITGQAEHLGVAADCERALGRPERALAYADDPDVPRLTQEQRVELVIVLAGARRDLGQADAAVLALQDPARRTTDKRPWAARLWYAYADALLAADRPGEAREWFSRAAGIDVDGQTDAGDRLLELDGVVLQDFDEEDEQRPDLLSAEELAEYVRGVPAPGPVADSTPAAGAPGPVEETAPAPEREQAQREGDERRPPSGVAAPEFVSPEPAEDLRLFD